MQFAFTKASVNSTLVAARSLVSDECRYVEAWQYGKQQNWRLRKGETERNFNLIGRETICEFLLTERYSHSATQGFPCVTRETPARRTLKKT